MDRNIETELMRLNGASVCVGNAIRVFRLTEGGQGRVEDLNTGEPELDISLLDSGIVVLHSAGKVLAACEPAFEGGYVVSVRGEPESRAKPLLQAVREAATACLDIQADATRVLRQKPRP